MSENAERTAFWERAQELALPFSAVCAMYAFGAAFLIASRAAWPPVGGFCAILQNGHLLLGLPPIIAGMEASWTVVFEHAGREDTLPLRVVPLFFIAVGAAAAAAGAGMGRVGFCVLMPFATGVFLAVLALPLRRKAFVTVFSVIATVSSSAALAAAAMALALARKAV